MSPPDIIFSVLGSLWLLIVLGWGVYGICVLLEID